MSQQHGSGGSVSFTNGTMPTQSDNAGLGSEYKAETMNFGDNGVLLHKL